MPPVDKAIVKDRARRLRAAGQSALVGHLDRQIGRTLSTLVEREGLGRAPDFTEVAIIGDASPGTIIPVRIVGHDNCRAQGVVA